VSEERPGERERGVWKAEDSSEFDVRALLTYPPLYVIAGSALAAVFESVRTSLPIGGLVLCGLITLYAYLARDSDAEREVVGDNCYFIGFVFTLVVISVSIYLDRGDLDSLLRAVSVALVTSIWGMLARFAVSHGAKESGEEFEDTIRKISDEAGRLSVALDETVSVTNSYNERLAEETEALGEQLNKVYARLMSDLAQKVHDALATAELDRVHSELSRAVDAHVGAVSLAGSSLERTSKSVDDIAVRLGDAAGKLQGSAVTFNAAVERADWKKVGETFEAFATRVSAAGDALGSMLEEQRKLAEDAGEDAARMAEVRANFQRAIGEMRKDMEEVVAIKQQYREKFGEAADQALEETHRLYARLIGGASVAIANIEKMGRMADDIERIAGRAKEGGGPVAPG